MSAIQCPKELQSLLEDLQGSSRDLVLDVYSKQTKQTENDVVLIDNKGKEWKIVVNLVTHEVDYKLTDLPKELQEIYEDVRGSIHDLVLDVYLDQTEKDGDDVVLVDKTGAKWAISVKFEQS